MIKIYYYLDVLYGITGKGITIDESDSHGE